MRRRRHKSGYDEATLWAGRVSVPVEIPNSTLKRWRGLIGKDGYADRGMLFSNANAIHTIFMKFPIDVAFLDKHLVVLDIVRMPPWRLGVPRLRARYVLEAEAGAFKQWGVRRHTQFTLHQSTKSTTRRMA